MSKIKAGSTESTSIEHISDTSGILELDSESGVVSFINTAGITLPAGTTAQRPASAVPGSLRINTTTGYMEIFYNSLWNPLTNLASIPSWTTASGSLGTLYDAERGVRTFTVAATDSDPSATLSYSVASGSLPTGMTINSSTGVISGTASAVASDTTHSFTLRVTNNSGASADRAFTILSKAPITQAFTYTGADQTFSLPTGLLRVNAYLWGAAGGGASAEGYSDSGGAGGYAYGLINTSSLTTLLVQVGAGGGRTDNGSTRPGRPYPNGGLPSVRNNYTSGAGGGRSAIFTTSATAANVVLIAGGGGGASAHGGGSGAAGSNMQGGNGGGSSGTGSMGYSSPNVELTALAGTQSAGGSSDSGAGRTAAQFQGADAGNGTLWDSGGWNTSGGGGDGWYGGGVVNNQHAGGGGGSGYINTSLVFNGVLTASTITSGKKSSVAPPQTASAYYSSGIGQGNVNATGGNGRIVFVY